MITPQDEQFLRRAMRLAMNGRGYTEPNPSVGCVLVKNGRTIGEGWTQPFGGAHAEPTALADCKARGNDPAGATAYVTIEPCCHTNKKTPPCAPRLIEARIARVVVGCLDPNPDVNGNGVAMLRAAGIDVDVLPDPRGTGLQPVSSALKESRVENPCHKFDGSHFQQLIAPFVLSVNDGGGWQRGYVTAKWAESADGFIAADDGRRAHITNTLSDRQVHLLRSRSDAIVVGIGTVLADNPSLTVRGVPPLRIPRRVILDRHLQTPVDCELVRTATQTPTSIRCSRDSWKTSPNRQLLESRGVAVDFMYGDDEGARLIARPEMYSFPSPTHVLVEPGPTLAKSLLPWIDRLWIFRSNKRLGTGVAAAAISDRYIPVGTLNLAGDTLTEYLNTASPAFFAAVPSADFVLAAEDAGQPVAWPSRP